MHSDSANEDGDDEKDEGENSSVEDNRRDHAALDIDTITGKAYAFHAQLQLHQSRKTLRCPHPAVDCFLPSSANISVTIHSTPASAPSASSSSRLSQAGCAYVFTRAYDLRRHLRSEHGIEVEKEVVEEWVVTARREKIQSGRNED
jgi:general transcription factor IIIA